MNCNRASNLQLQTNPNGSPFGTLCILDKGPRDYSEEVHSLLQEFRGTLEEHLALIHFYHDLGAENQELSELVAEIKKLQGIIPICSYCQRIRDDNGFWNDVNEYLTQLTKTSLSHGICPECVQRQYPDLADKILKPKNESS